MMLHPSSLRVLIIGHGRMGQAVERAAAAAGHQVVGCLGRAELLLEAWPEADVAVEFTLPGSALEVFAACRKRNLPLVSGTTGWEAHRAEVEQAVSTSGHAMLWASNFSVGVHLLRKAMAAVQSVMGSHDDYTPSIHEIHHVGKKDAPSGTAKTLKADLQSMGKSVPVTAERIAGVPGVHHVEWKGPYDSITLTHSAMGREGFALGAVRAAEWLVSKPGPHDRIFGMEDVWG